jgi:hypothetical protein
MFLIRSFLVLNILYPQLCDAAKEGRSLDITNLLSDGANIEFTDRVRRVFDLRDACFMVIVCVATLSGVCIGRRCLV